MTDVELIKSKIDIVNFISEYIPLKKTGRNFKANCPFHHEKTPSFVVSAERQTWHCFGACQEGGDAISFLQKWENIEFVEALKTLAERVGITLSHFTPTESSALKDKLYAINRLAAEFYHYLFLSHIHGKKAREYVFGRDIKEETVKTFLVGYAPSSWDSLLKFVTKKGYTTSDMYTAGLLSRSAEGRYFDRFRGRLMFPLADPRGNIIAFAGRVIPPASSTEAKYINTAETPIYIKGNTLYGLHITRDAIKREKEAIVVEGEFDLMASFQAGVGNVVAIKGSAFTQEQTVLLRRYTEQLILALDSDFAGNEAARRGIEVADAAGFTMRVVELPFGKDPAECVAKSPHLWKEAVKKAVPIYDFVIDTAIKKYDKTDVYGKKKIAAEVLPYLSKLPNLIVQSHYIKKLARELDVAEESISQSLSTIRSKGTLETTAPRKPGKDRTLILEEHLLSLLIQGEHPKKAMLMISEIVTAKDFAQPALSFIYSEMESYLLSHDAFDFSLFGKSLKEEYAVLFDRLNMTDIESILIKKERYNHEIMQTACMVKLVSLRRSINKLATDIRLTEEQGDEQKAISLQQESKKLLDQIKEVEKIRSIQVQ